MNSKLTKEQFITICDTHANESMWYLFLNYGCPVRPASAAPEYVEKYQAVSKALEEYVIFIRDQEKILYPNGNDETEFNL